MLNKLHTRLKSIPAIHTQELLLYIFEKKPEKIIKIITLSGHTYSGLVLHFGKTREAQDVLTLQLCDEYKTPIQRVLHLMSSYIEGVELDETDAVAVLSKGNVVYNPSYETSGKLELKRCVKEFESTITKTYDVSFKISDMDLSNDGYALHRIIRLVKIIQGVIIEIFEQQDAQECWKATYQTLAFVEGENLLVGDVGNTLEIAFPYSDIYASEINKENLALQIQGFCKKG